MIESLNCCLQWDWLEATVHMKDVLKCITAAVGEQCVMMDSLTQQQECFAALLDFRMLILWIRYITIIRSLGLTRHTSWPMCWMLTLCVRPRAQKLPEAGAHREISRFSGGPVRHWYLQLRLAVSDFIIIRAGGRTPVGYLPVGASRMLRGLMLGMGKILCACAGVQMHYDGLLIIL